MVLTQSFYGLGNMRPTVTLSGSPMGLAKLGLESGLLIPSRAFSHWVLTSHVSSPVFISTSDFSLDWRWGPGMMHSGGWGRASGSALSRVCLILAHFLLGNAIPQTRLNFLTTETVHSCELINKETEAQRGNVTC